MDLTKLFFLSILVSLSTCYRKQLLNTQSWNPIRIEPKFAPNLKQCFCYLQKTSGTPVLEKLANNGENLKRLVVYLYQNPTTNEINLFVPNNEKQMVIPDLYFDDGDQLETPSDNLQTVFTEYPDLVSERRHIINNPDVPKFVRPIRKIKGINAPPKQNIVKLYDDTIFYDNPNSIRAKNTPSPSISNSDLDLEYIQDQNLNIDLNNPMQPYIDIEGDNSDAPINVVSVNINRKKANPNVINPLQRNIIRITRPSRDQINTNLNSNDVLYDFTEDYVGNNEMDGTSTSPGDTESPSDDGDGDDIDTPDPEEIIAENDFKDMPSELTDEITTDFDAPNFNRQKSYTQIAIMNKKNPIIRIQTVPTEFINIEQSPTTDAPADINNVIQPIENEMQPQDSLDFNSNINEETAPPVENETNVQPELLEDGNDQVMNVNQNGRESDENSGEDSIDYSIQRPNVIVSSDNMPSDSGTITPMTINVQKKPLDTLLPDSELPIDYVKNEIIRNQQMLPGDLSFFNIHPDTLIKDYGNVNGIGFQDTFDNWFDQQMKRVRFINSRASNSIDIYTLKYLIEKTLHEKGMFVTEKGYIIDSDGHILNTANLGLRPILIGNSVEYKNLLQGKFTTYKLPMDMPYLEAVLITSMNPPKILGIIPLGKTYLPNAIQKPLPYYVNNGIIPNSCGGVCNMRDMLVPSLNSRRHRGNPYIGSTRSKTRVAQNSQKGRTRGPGTRRIFPFDGLNSFIDKIYSGPLREPKVIRRPSTYVVNYETGPIITRKPVIKYPVPIAVSEVTPGFRIIGGNPATSSGTPVSSRGRSGYDS